jgi:hypothetical protein
MKIGGLIVIPVPVVIAIVLIMIVGLNLYKWLSAKVDGVPVSGSNDHENDEEYPDHAEICKKAHDDMLEWKDRLINKANGLYIGPEDRFNGPDDRF